MEMKFWLLFFLRIFLIVDVCFENVIYLSAFRRAPFGGSSSFPHKRVRERTVLLLKGPFKDAFDYYGKRYDEVKVQVRNKLKVYLESSLPIAVEQESADEDNEKIPMLEKPGVDVKTLEIESIKRKLAAIQPMIPQFEKFIDEYAESDNFSLSCFV
jgi:hypothetical protein